MSVLNCRLANEPIFRQGFCKRCFFDLPQAADWIIRPELSTAHLDQEDRDLEYEKRVQLQPHIVYLANSSNVKVGVTRKSPRFQRVGLIRVLMRRLKLLRLLISYLAGVTEVALKSHVADKTNWRKMLKNDVCR